MRLLRLKLKQYSLSVSSPYFTPLSSFLLLSTTSHSPLCRRKIGFARWMPHRALSLITVTAPISSEVPLRSRVYSLEVSDTPCWDQAEKVGVGRLAKFLWGIWQVTCPTTINCCCCVCRLRRRRYSIITISSPSHSASKTLAHTCWRRSWGKHVDS